MVHHFIRLQAKQAEIENNLNDQIDANTIYPKNKPSWTPLWMWQEIQNQQRDEQISKVLYSAHTEQEDLYEYEYEDEEEDDLEENFNANSDYYDDIYQAALDEYYENMDEYDFDMDDIENLNENMADDDDEELENENMKQDAWIEMSESATHDFDTEWDNDEHWDEVMEMKTWEGTHIQRKCLHLWKHRLCLCQFLGWMDTNKYQCIYHKRSWSPITHAPQKYNHVIGHVSDTMKEPRIVIHGGGGDYGGGRIKGPIIHHFVGNPSDGAQYAVHHFHHFGPLRGRRRRRRSKVIIQRDSPIHWHIQNPVIVHHFHHVLDHPRDHYPGGEEVMRLDGRGREEEEVEERQMEHEHGMIQRRARVSTRGGEYNREQAEKKREAAERKREEAEKAREKKFQSLLWKDRHAHKMWKLMKDDSKPIWGKTATGRDMIVAQHIDPHGKPLMVAMHKHMPNHRPQWMPQGLFTNLKHRGYYMVHHHHPGDHATGTADEQRWAHGSDIVPQGGDVVPPAAATMQEYDVYDNYYYADEDMLGDHEVDDDYMYDDEYYYNSEFDNLFDFDKIYDRYNDEKYEVIDGDDYFGNKYIDRFVDNFNNEWVISDVISNLESTFQNLFGGNDDEDGYWDSMELLDTKKC